MIAKDFKDLRNTIQTWLDDINNEAWDKSTKTFLSQLSEHDARMYIAGMKQGLQSVKNIMG
jgi:hypothetical protein